jgi:chorismate-pyruvate lyase
MNIIDFLIDYGSTTAKFKEISSKYELKIIYTKQEQEHFERLVLIVVDDIPVMFGLSKTALNNNHFKQILSNVEPQPIGNKLFAPHNKIRRKNMTIKQITPHTVENIHINQHFSDNQIKQAIYYRESNFNYENETMLLEEYVLPGLEDLILRHNAKSIYKE